MAESAWAAAAGPPSCPQDPVYLGRRVSVGQSVLARRCKGDAVSRAPREADTRLAGGNESAPQVDGRQRVSLPSPSSTRVPQPRRTRPLSPALVLLSLKTRSCLIWQECRA